MIWYYIQFRIVDIRIATFKGTIIIGCVKLSNLFLSMLRLEELWIFESSLFLCIDIFVQGGSILNPDITFLWQFFPIHYQFHFPSIFKNCRAIDEKLDYQYY